VCQNTPFFEGVQQQKINPPKNPSNAAGEALLMSRFQKFTAGNDKKKPHCTRCFETTLRAVLIDQLIIYVHT